MSKKHVWNVSVRGDKKVRGVLRAESLDNFYVVAPDVEAAVKKAIKESGIERAEYVQVSRVTKLRGLV